MDAQEAFKAMLEDVGSSIDELRELGVSAHPRSNAKIDLFYTITKDWEPAAQVEKKPDGSWETKMLFDIYTLHFADPDSLEKLKDFIERARNKELKPTDYMWESVITQWPEEEEDADV